MYGSRRSSAPVRDKTFPKPVPLIRSIDTRFEEPGSACDDDGHIILIFPDMKCIHVEDMDLAATLVG
ncbi:uncharacterized protein SCHCODRAFT_02623919 [Schizophyllum commune H4-8]|uniref:uncharacterized protein n=1 Tax=Schizophyllum commune (strain H4-8 / FGSC 9210) TaxID=578458 RepID=UPI00215FF00D|nr:uncharacterized protein SCHCODRAFT_02623919 [Schizophyllum commune H4-8]KAI5894166.1 hypothetical protein SCHCODRAFT_02623919 [Schizophyllum commune H4-8]